MKLRVCRDDPAGLTSGPLRGGFRDSPFARQERAEQFERSCVHTGRAWRSNLIRDDAAKLNNKGRVRSRRPRHGAVRKTRRPTGKRQRAKQKRVQRETCAVLATSKGTQGPHEKQILLKGAAVIGDFVHCFHHDVRRRITAVIRHDVDAVGTNGLHLRHDVQIPALVQLHVRHHERFQSGTKLRSGSPHALRDSADLASLPPQHCHNSVRFTQFVGAQHNRIVSIKGHLSIIRAHARIVLERIGRLRMQQNCEMKANRTTPSRMPERVSATDRDALDRLLADTRVGHFAFIDNDRPAVMPIAFAPASDALILHGSTGSWWLRRLAAGIPVTASVMSVDGLVYARSAFESSMRYRSAILFGSCERLEGDGKLEALDRITESLLPGRHTELRAHNRKELAATMILRMTIDEWTYKNSTQWPEDPDDDIAGDTWAGVLPIRTTYGDPLDAPDLRDGIPVSPSVRRLAGADRVSLD